MKGRPMTGFLAAFLLGLVLSDKVPPFALLCFFTGSTLLCFLFAAKDNRHILLWPVFFLLGILCMQKAVSLEPAERMFTKETQVTVSGTVLSYEFLDSSGKLFLSDATITDLSLKKSCACHKLLLYSDSYPVKIGQRVFITGKVSPLSHAANQGQFDEYSYQKANGVCLKGFVSSLVITDPSFDRLKQGCKTFTTWCVTQITTLLPEKEASVLCAVLFGDKTRLSDDMKELYKENGMAHMMAVSGLHISILGYAVYGLLRKLTVPVPLSCVLPVLLLVFYGRMTGFQVSTKRAIIMFVFLMIAAILGRTYDSISALCAAAITILFFQPLQLYQAGFLLSFSALFGIDAVYPAFFVLFHEPEEKWKKTLLLSGSVQLATIPFLAYFFFELSPYSILLNLILLPLCSILVLGGFVAVLVSFVSVSFGKFCCGIVYGILKLYEGCMKSTEMLPYHLVLTGKPSVFFIVFYFCILAVVLFWCFRGKAKWCLLLLCLPFCIIVRPSSSLSVTCLDVGQGDGIVITKGASCILIDGGSNSQKELYEYCLKPYLKSRNIRCIDAVFISHSDADHMNGVEQMLVKMGEEGVSRKDYSGEIYVKKLFLPDVTGDDGFDRLLQEAVKLNLPVYKTAMGDELSFGQMFFSVLHPARGNCYPDANSESMVLWLSCGEFDGLFTGDLPETKEAVFLSLYREKLLKQKFDLLKVAHHGSMTSTGEELLCVIQPKTAVISVGADNSYGHPHKETLEKLLKHGCEVRITKEEGMIEIDKKGQR